MIHYLITYFISILFCATLLADDFLTQSHLNRALMTTSTIQQQSKRLNFRIKATLPAVCPETTMNANRSRAQQLGDHYINHCATQDTTTNRLIQLKFKLKSIKADVLRWQPPRFPQAVQLAGVFAMILHMPMNRCITLCNLTEEKLHDGEVCAAQVSMANPREVETTSNHLLPLLRKITACFHRSAAFLTTTKVQSNDLQAIGAILKHLRASLS